MLLVSVEKHSSDRYISINPYVKCYKVLCVKCCGIKFPKRV